MENNGFEFINNPFEEIKKDCLETYGRIYDKFMIRVPRTSEHIALFHLSDEQVMDYISFFEVIKWKSVYDQIYLTILKDYQIKRRIEKIIILKNKIQC